MATDEQVVGLAQARGVSVGYVRRLLKHTTIEALKKRWWLNELPALDLADFDPSTCRAVWRAVLWRGVLDLGAKPGEFYAWVMSQSYVDVCSLADVIPRCPRYDTLDTNPHHHHVKIISRDIRRHRRRQ